MKQNDAKFLSVGKKDVIVEIHNSSSHDGGVAIYLPDVNKIYALASERVGKRLKHDADSRIAYDYIKEIFSAEGYRFGTPYDGFDPNFKPSQKIHHHLAHAASAFYASGFENSAVLVMDGYGLSTDGNYNSTSIWLGDKSRLIELSANTEKAFPSQSLGYFYSGATYFLGFGKLESGKTMGLAPYGKKSKIYRWLKQYAHGNNDGTYYIHPTFLQALRHVSGGSKLSKIKEMTAEVEVMMDDILLQLGKPREKDADITARDRNFAWAVQKILEEIITGLARYVKDLTKSENLCLSGGVALNSVANGKIVDSSMFKNVFIQPAAGDDGQALGKLLFVLKNKYKVKHSLRMGDAYTGPSYPLSQVEETLEKYKNEISYEMLSEQEMIYEAASSLAAKKIIGWFQGGSEIGPRALGHRSILADPRQTWMRDYINFEVKHREGFRPFAPSVLEEKADEYFELNSKSPFMLLVGKVKEDKQKIVPAITHVDGTARIQTVSRENNTSYYSLIKEFEKLTTIPLVLNTSFNNAGEPIVETPEDAVKAFLAMKLDLLVIDNYVIQKKVSRD